MQTAQKYFRIEVENAVVDLGTITHALTGLYCAYDTLNDVSDKTVPSIISSISKDLDSLHDHFTRLLNGICPIREAPVNTLRACEECENNHAKIQAKYI